MRIALTGATGFLGRYLVRQLTADGHTLNCWHRPTSDRSGFDGLETSLTWIEGDLANPNSMPPLLDGCDALVHNAVAWAGPRNRVGGGTHGDSDVFFFTNLTGTLQLFQQARAQGIPRCVYISTCAVHEVILEDRPLDEAHPLWPKTHYGAHKAAVEKFIHSYGFGEGWPICSLRPTGIYGATHPIENSRWYNLVGAVKRGDPIGSPRGGKEVHASDVAKAASLLLGATDDSITGQAFNCYDIYVSEQKVAEIAKELTGSSSSIDDLNRGPKHQIDTKKLRSLGMTFGGEPLLRSTIQEMVDHRR